MARLAEEERDKQRQVGARIADAREERRLTQPTVADRVGVSLRAYQNWEAGHTRIAWANLGRLAAVLGVSEDYLLSGDGRGEPAVPLPTSVVEQFAEIDARLANIEEMLSQLLQIREEQATDPEAALAGCFNSSQKRHDATLRPRSPTRRAVRSQSPPRANQRVPQTAVVLAGVAHHHARLIDRVENDKDGIRLHGRWHSGRCSYAGHFGHPQARHPRALSLRHRNAVSWRAQTRHFV
jgi:transcriptional regulator with XRE-family HTH domain